MQFLHADRRLRPQPRRPSGAVAAGAFAVDLGRDYDFLLDLRQTADYGGVAEASLASAKKAILAALEPLLPNDADGNA